MNKQQIIEILREITPIMLTAEEWDAWRERVATRIMEQQPEVSDGIMTTIRQLEDIQSPHPQISEGRIKDLWLKYRYHLVHRDGMDEAGFKAAIKDLTKPEKSK